MTPVIELSRIVKTYRIRRSWWRSDPLRAVDGVDLRVESGEILGLLGKNGAGKTTLIKIMAGLLRADGGEGRVLGYDIERDHKKIRASVSLVAPTADVGTDNALTVRQNLEFWAVVYNLDEHVRAARIDELLAFLDLERYQDAWPMSISAGMRQRLAIARSLLVSNPILFLDEPTVKLDAQGAQAVREFIRRINRDFGITMILTTHLIFEAEALCDRVAIMDRGKILSCDSVLQLRKHLQRYDACTIETRDVPDGVRLQVQSRHSGALRRGVVRVRRRCPQGFGGTPGRGPVLRAQDPARTPSRYPGRGYGRADPGGNLPQHRDERSRPMIGFLRAGLSFAWLELKALRFYPVNGLLQVVQSFVSVGIWFFVSLFLRTYAAPSLAQYGGDFVAYMVIGVLFFQNTGAMMTLPLESLSTAYWDRRLEVYHSRRYGLWAFITGRFIWLFCYNALILAVILAVALGVAGVHMDRAAPILPAVSFYVVFVLTCLGIGLIGASTFFFLEVKQGRDPVTWLVDVLAQIFSGVYYPLSILPPSVHWIAGLIPHTYALRGIRLVMINGSGFGSADTRQAFLILLGFCAVSLAAGIGLFNRALAKAERTNGIGIPL